MTVPGNINDAGGNIVVEIECDSDYNSIPSNWQTTDSGKEINVAYCGFDMVSKLSEERERASRIWKAL